MTKLKLLLRNLRYFSGVNLAVILGMAVATAVLTGALMVGDSVRGSLSDLALRRLGPVDYALISTRLFPESLAEDLGPEVVPGIIMRGGAKNTSAPGDDKNKPRTADVQIAALGGASLGKPPFDFPGFPLGESECVINGALARDLAVTDAGATIEFRLPTDADTPREAALAQRNRNDLQSTISPSVKYLDAGEGFTAVFSPRGSQRVQRNAWVNLRELQRQINPRPTPVTKRRKTHNQDAHNPDTPVDLVTRVNTLLAHGTDPNLKPDEAVKALNDRIAVIARGAGNNAKTDGLRLYGLSIKSVGYTVEQGYAEASLFSDETYLPPAVIDAAKKAATALNMPVREVSVNLINKVTSVANPQKSIHYTVGAGISSLDQGVLGTDEMAINEWTAEQLGVKLGDTLRIDFYVRTRSGSLVDTSAPEETASNRPLTFKVKFILPMSGLGADSDLPPVYRGLTDVDSPRNWKKIAGLDIDSKLADEPYWNKYGPAPKLFINIDTARKLWGGMYGDVTGLRFAVPHSVEQYADRDKDIAAKDAVKNRFVKQFLAEMKPEAMGLAFRPIKAEQVAAAQGGTDFGMFFLMFSFFLIVAAALLVAMLFRLNVEQRARQLGLMSAVGFSPAALRRLALSEGMILAGIGSVIGIGGAIGYTSLIMLGLRTWWIGAVGTTAMTLHIVPLTLAYGWGASLFVAFLAILWAVWRIGKAQPSRLLAGGWGVNIRRRGDGKWLRWIGIGVIVIGLATVGVALAGKISAEEGFGGGAIVLCGGLLWLGADLRPKRHEGVSFAGQGSLARLGVRNATRHTARGVLSVGLIAFAAFTLITVAALKQVGVKDPGDRNSETGGYRLILTAGIPLANDLNTPKGRQSVGMDDADASDSTLYTGVHFTMLRQWAGQDISCLNLTKPSSPTILGVPPEMIERGGFIPGDSIDKEKGKIWTLLDSDQGDEIPVIADSDTQEYVLQIKLGDTIPITDQLGKSRKLKLVATIAHSIFQGQLLMGETNFRKLFPAQGGFNIALIDAPAGKEAELIGKLNSSLSEYSVSVDTTSDRLQTYQKVQNTYLETFQTLGALGLMLGTLGLAVVLVRTVIERKGELALLASLGFAPAARVKLILAENAFLLVVGLVLGAASAVVGILPAVMREARPINVLSLAGTLGIVLVVGLISSATAVGLSGTRATPADLRHE